MEETPPQIERPLMPTPLPECSLPQLIPDPQAITYILADVQGMIEDLLEEGGGTPQALREIAYHSKLVARLWRSTYFSLQECSEVTAPRISIPPDLDSRITYITRILSDSPTLRAP